MKIGIVGAGVVGGALEYWVKNNTNHTVAVSDPPQKRFDSFKDVEAIFVCVPVPTRADRSQDLSIVNEVLGIHHKSGKPIFIRSTVLPGTCDALSKAFKTRVISCPEFLTERVAYLDVVVHDVLVGGPLEHSEAELLMRLFPQKRIHQMTNVEAELAKYYHNTFAAVKVNHSNVFYEACQKFKADYRNVIKGASITGFIENTHTQVPGPDSKRGYGGKCLPKDLRAIVGLFKKHNVESLGLLGTESDNECYRGEVMIGVEK